MYLCHLDESGTTGAGTGDTSHFVLAGLSVVPAAIPSMPREFPPFGGTDDADIENALQWFLGFLDAGDWKTCVAAIERNIETAMQPRTRNFDAGDYVSAYGGRDAWRGTSTWWTPRCTIR